MSIYRLIDLACLALLVALFLVVVGEVRRQSIAAIDKQTTIPEQLAVRLWWWTFGVGYDHRRMPRWIRRLFARTPFHDAWSYGRTCARSDAAEREALDRKEEPRVEAGC